MNLTFYGNNNVMTRGNQRANVNFRVRDELRDEFTAVAMLLETSVSDLLKMYMRAEIERVKDARPVDFISALNEVKAEKAAEAQRKLALEKENANQLSSEQTTETKTEDENKVRSQFRDEPPTAPPVEEVDDEVENPDEQAPDENEKPPDNLTQNGDN